MARILIMSSWVSVGHVGLSAAMPALNALGHEVTGLPTVLLSNHPGWPHVGGAPVPAPELAEMRAALAANGWLGGHDAVLIGYMPTPEHVAEAVATIAAVRATRPAPRILVDPILGDAPKGLYVAEAAAAAIRDQLVPLADVITPNRFELGWLTGRPVETLADVAAAAAALAPPSVLVTSPPLGPGETGVFEAATGSSYRVPVHADVPHGVGDVFAALIAAGAPVGVALGHLQALIAASLGSPHLEIVGAAPRWTQAGAIPSDPETMGAA